MAVNFSIKQRPPALASPPPRHRRAATFDPPVAARRSPIPQPAALLSALPFRSRPQTRRAGAGAVSSLGGRTATRGVTRHVGRRGRQGLWRGGRQGPASVYRSIYGYLHSAQARWVEVGEYITLLLHRGLPGISTAIWPLKYDYAACTYTYAHCPML